MTAIGVLKSLKPEGWPDRINVGRAVARFPNGTESGSWYSRPQGDDETAEYVRRDPAVLAALPEVQAMVEEAIKYAVEAESRPWASICRNQGGSTICAEMCGFCAAAIRAKGGEA